MPVPAEPPDDGGCTASLESVPINPYQYQFWRFWTKKIDSSNKSYCILSIKWMALVIGEANTLLLIITFFPAQIPRNRKIFEYLIATNCFAANSGSNGAYVWRTTKTTNVINETHTHKQTHICPTSKETLNSLMLL